MDDQDGNGRIYISHERDLQSLGDTRKSIEYYEKRSKIAIEIGDRGAEGKAYGYIGIA
mgnify:CR=1 FL=1